MSEIENIIPATIFKLEFVSKECDEDDAEVDTYQYSELKGSMEMMAIMIAEHFMDCPDRFTDVKNIMDAVDVALKSPEFLGKNRVTNNHLTNKN